MAENQFHWRKLFLFAILSLVDFCMTWRLLQFADANIHVYESNPFAGAWLANYGWMGLIFFKTMMVLVIGAVSVVLSGHCPRMAGRVLIFACLATSTVILYSATLTAAIYYEPLTKIMSTWDKG